MGRRAERRVEMRRERPPYFPIQHRARRPQQQGATAEQPQREQSAQRFHAPSAASTYPRPRRV